MLLEELTIVSLFLKNNIATHSLKNIREFSFDPEKCHTWAEEYFGRRVLLLIAVEKIRCKLNMIHFNFN
jgi:hypothetical protein